MKDLDKNQQQLIEELVELREQVAAGRRALRETETAAALLQGAPLGIHECDTEGRITFVNPSQEAITGYPAEELLGSRAWDRIVPGPDKDSLPAFFKRLVAEQPPPTPYVSKNIRKNGEVFDVRVDWNYKRNPLGQVTGFVCVISDVTEQRRAEEALRQSEQRYRTLAESTTDIIYILDESGTLRYGNRSAAAYVGVSPESLVGKTQHDLFPPEIAERHLKRIGTVFETGEPGEAEEAYRFGSHNVWLNVRSIPLRDEQGRVTSVMGVCRDISGRKHAEGALRKAHDELEQRVQERTAELREANARLEREVEERRRAEEALRESHDQLRAIHDGMVDGILLTNIETMQFVRANAAICRMLGYSETELLSLGISDIHPADVLPDILEKIRSSAVLKRTGTANISFLRKDGSVFEAEAMGTFVTYHAKLCSMGIFRDVTERKRAEAAIAESEAKYRRLVETTDTGYVILDDEGRVVDANAQYVRLCGHHDLGEIVGRSVKEWTAPHDLARAENQVAQCLRAGFVRQLEVQYIHPDGRVMPIEVNATSIRTKDGTRILSLCRDITERRQARDALLRERRTLEHMLRASDHERRLIAYDIHDGLAQELAGAIMQFQIHDQFKQSKPDEAQKAYDGGVTLLRQAHTEARRLISGVRPPILDESGVVAAIAHLVRDPAFDHGPKIALRSRVTFNRLTPAAENMVYRIVQEGLSNARAHSGSKRVAVSLIQRGDRLRIEVRDWGVGFDRNAVPKNRFGLEGIRERARLLGGKATIETDPGKGTRVVVDLPVVLQQPEDEQSGE